MDGCFTKSHSPNFNEFMFLFDKVWTIYCAIKLISGYNRDGCICLSIPPDLTGGMGKRRSINTVFAYHIIICLVDTRRVPRFNG